MLNLGGSTAPINTAGTVESIMTQIKETGGESVLPLKGNQKNSYRDAIAYFENRSHQRFQDFGEFYQTIFHPDT